MVIHIKSCVNNDIEFFALEFPKRFRKVFTSWNFSDGMFQVLKAGFEMASEIT